MLSEDDLALMSDQAEESSALAKQIKTPPRLFSSTGSSTLFEWDWCGPTSGRPKSSISSGGGNIWSLAANATGTTLALGCEDGGIRLVNLWDGEFEVVKCLDRVNTRLLSIAWGPQAPISRRQDLKGKGRETEEAQTNANEDVYVVVGCADSSVRKWDVRSGRCTSKMKTDKSGREHTLVWSVAVLKDHTIVSGDSMGFVRFWDGIMGIQHIGYRAHQADVLCLTVSSVRPSSLRKS